MNPLLDFSALPRFDAIQPEHVAPAIQELLAENRRVVERLARPDTPATWAGFMAPLTDAGERLSRAWGIVGHLHSVNDIPPWREAYNAQLPEVTRFYSELGQNQALFAKLKELRASDEYARLSETQQRIVHNDIRDFRLSGADLAEADKPRFQAIQEELAALEAKFSENLLDATNAYGEYVDDEAQLAGIPADVCQTARDAAAKEGKSGWKFTLHAPSYGPVMQYAEHRELRARMYRAYATRASEHGAPEFDNTPLIGQLLRLRDEAACLLGYLNYAEVSLVPKMAETPQQVAGFLREIAAKARPYAEKDIAELREFARKELGMAQLESWDLAWAAEKLKQARYAFSDEEVKQYLPEPQVIAGLFRVIESLFGVTLAPDQAPVWHPEVRFFRIERAGVNGTELIGQFSTSTPATRSAAAPGWTRRSRAGVSPTAACRRRWPISTATSPLPSAKRMA